MGSAEDVPPEVGGMGGAGFRTGCCVAVIVSTIPWVMSPGTMGGGAELLAIFYPAFVNGVGKTNVSHRRRQ